MRTALMVVLGVQSALAAPATVERIAAVVNQEIILLSEVKERAAMLAQAGEVGEGQLKQLVERMVEDVLVVQQAVELKLTVEEAEIDRAADEVMKQNHLDAAQFKEALSAQGYTLAAYRRDLRRQLLRLKVINAAVRSHISISDDELKAFYEQSARQSGGRRQSHLRHVLVALPAGADEKEVERRRRIALRVVEQARAGTSFAELANTYSDDGATKKEGGDLGWVEPGVLENAVDEVVLTLEAPSEVRGPIKTARGFEVLQLVEKKEGDVRPFAEVKEQLRQQLYASQLEKQTLAWLTELRKKAHIEIRL